MCSHLTSRTVNQLQQDGQTLRCVIPVVCVTNEREESVVNQHNYEGWNFNSGNYLFTTDTK